MKSFATCIMMLEEDVEYVKRLETGNDFSFSYRDDPTFTNWESESGYSSLVASRPSEEEIERHFSADEKPAKELIIHVLMSTLQIRLFVLFTAERY